MSTGLWIQKHSSKQRTPRQPTCAPFNRYNSLVYTRQLGLPDQRLANYWVVSQICTELAESKVHRGRDLYVEYIHSPKVNYKETVLQQEHLCQACISLVPRPHPLTTKGLLSVSLVVSSQRPWFFQQVNDYDIVLVLWIASTLGWDAILLTCSELGLLTWHNQESTQWSFPCERVRSGHIGGQSQTFILHSVTKAQAEL